MKSTCFKKVHTCLPGNDTKKLALVFFAKDNILSQQISNVIFCLTCPGCNESNTGKTDHDLVMCLNEHGSRVMNLCISTRILIPYLLPQIIKNTCLILFHLILVTGPNCCFQRQSSSRCHLFRIVIVSKRHTNFFLFQGYLH